jgi:hypothetical protein
MDLAWLSWRDVWSVANDAKGHLPAKDLATLLHSKALNCFDGFAPTSFVAPVSGSFWHGPTAFGRLATVHFSRSRAYSAYAGWASGRFFSKERSE